MRWCVNNCICVFVFRHLPSIVLVVVFLLSVNQVVQFAREKGTPTCYRFAAPFPRLHQVPRSGDSSAGIKSSEDEESDSILPNIPWSQARFDDRRMVRIYDWVWTGLEWSNLMENHSTCLATQGSIERVASIGEVVDNWRGPISLAIYLHNMEELWITSIFMSYMRRCSPLFSATVSVHIVVPVGFKEPSSYNQTLYFEVMSEEYPCGEPQQFMSSLMSKLLFTVPEGLYPQNHMRNVARKNCNTPWVWMTDVDIIPKPNASLLLNAWFKETAKKCAKCAFVIPVFEVDKSVKFPTTKKQVAALVEKKLARQFHLNVYRNGHWATNYSLWLSTNLDEGRTQISHKIDNNTLHHYEPFYVSSDDIPRHDERFIGYGFTRSSQVLEARMMGWKFFVLTPVFAIHWGLQTHQTLQRSPSLPIPLLALKKSSAKNHKSILSRKAQNANNYYVYSDFVAELTARYNISMRRKKPSKKQLKPKQR